MQQTNYTHGHFYHLLVKSAIAVSSCDLESCFWLQKGASLFFLNDRIVHPKMKMKGDIIYSNSFSKRMFFFLWLHTNCKLLGRITFCALPYNKKGCSCQAPKNNRKHYETIKKWSIWMVYYIHKGSNQNVVCLSISCSVIDIFRLGHILLVSILSY